MKKQTRSKKYSLLVYVENCNPKVKRFDSIKKLESFVDTFNEKYPDNEAIDTGYWIDFYVTGVTGKLVPNENLDFEVT